MLDFAVCILAYRQTTVYICRLSTFQLTSFVGAGTVLFFLVTANKQCKWHWNAPKTHLPCSYRELLLPERWQFPLIQMHFTIHRTYLLNSYDEAASLIATFLPSTHQKHTITTSRGQKKKDAQKRLWKPRDKKATGNITIFPSSTA